jgi:hypothetical protein
MMELAALFADSMDSWQADHTRSAIEKSYHGYRLSGLSVYGVALRATLFGKLAGLVT